MAERPPIPIAIFDETFSLVTTHVTTVPSRAGGAEFLLSGATSCQSRTFPELRRLLGYVRTDCTITDQNTGSRILPTADQLYQSLSEVKRILSGQDAGDGPGHEYARQLATRMRKPLDCLPFKIFDVAHKRPDHRSIVMWQQGSSLLAAVTWPQRELSDLPSTTNETAQQCQQRRHDVLTILTSVAAVCNQAYAELSASDNRTISFHEVSALGQTFSLWDQGANPQTTRDARPSTPTAYKIHSLHPRDFWTKRHSTDKESRPVDLVMRLAMDEWYDSTPREPCQNAQFRLKHLQEGHTSLLGRGVPSNHEYSRVMMQLSCHLIKARDMVDQMATNQSRPTSEDYQNILDQIPTRVSGDKAETIASSESMLSSMMTKVEREVRELGGDDGASREPTNQAWLERSS